MNSRETSFDREQTRAAIAHMTGAHDPAAPRARMSLQA